MNLPLGRPRTYVDGMPLIPDDINELFDAVIDGKHDETEIVYAASNFMGGVGGVGAGIVQFGAAQLNFSGPSTVYCGIQVPAGHRVTSIRWNYRVGVGDTVAFKLGRRLFDDLTPTTDVAQVDLIGNPTTDSAAGGMVSPTIVYNHYVASDCIYYLLFSTTNGAANTNLFGASVKFDKL